MKSTCHGAIVLLVVLAAGQAAAQPTLDQLWPNPDGLRLSYQYSWHNAQTAQSFSSDAYLQLLGTVSTAGGEAQNLYAGHGDLPLPAAARPPVDGPLGRIWQARPDLRAEIERRYAGAGKGSQETWAPYLLHGGYFMKTATAIEMWQPSWDHSTWTYLQDDISVGASFSHQLIPEVATDLWLYGSIGAVGATVITPNGVYDEAVRVDYVIDFGLSEWLNESGELIGIVHSETHGHVHYVPNVGPVEMLEQHLPYITVDCGTADCPPEWTDWLGEVVETQTLALTAAPVPSESVSWGEVKTLFR